MRSLLLFIPALLFGVLVNAQNAGSSEIQSTDKRIDSLLQVLETSKEDTGKINTIFELGLLYYAKDRPEDLLRLGNQALKLSMQLHYGKGTGLAHLLISKHFHKKKNYDEAFKNTYLALNILRSAGDKNGLAHCYLQVSRLNLNLGNAGVASGYRDSAIWLFHVIGKEKEEADLYIEKGLLSAYRGENGAALESHYAALNIYEKLGDQSGIGSALGSIGFTYYGSKDDSLAEQFLIEANEIFKKEGNKFGYAENIITLGDLKLGQGRHDEARQLYNEAFEIFHLPGAPKTGIPWCHDCFARVYSSIGDSANAAGNPQLAVKNHEKALADFITSLENYSLLNLVTGIAQEKSFIGEVYFKLNRYQPAKKYLRQSLEGLKNSELNESIARTYLYLSKIDSIGGSFANAYKHFQLYTFYNGKSVNASITKKVEVYKARDKILQKEKEIKLLESENVIKSTLVEKKEQQKLFAYVAIAVLVSISSYGFYRYRRHKKTEMEQAQMRYRLHISQGLHDDIGSTLSSISVYSQVAQRLNEKDEKKEMNEMLEKISDTSNEMVSEMSDIVWAIHPKNDSMERVIQRMENFAKPMLATRNIHLRFTYPPSVLTARLDMEKRKNLYLIFKEIINNAFKYSGCTLIAAEISHSNKHLELNISDNGIGFDIHRETAENRPTLSGNGLRNMQVRAAEMKGELQIISSSGHGTSIKLVIPLP